MRTQSKLYLSFHLESKLTQEQEVRYVVALIQNRKFNLWATREPRVPTGLRRKSSREVEKQAVILRAVLGQVTEPQADTESADITAVLGSIRATAFLYCPKINFPVESATEQ